MKAPCRFGEWFNAAPHPDAPPDTKYRCKATGKVWKPGGGKKADQEGKTICLVCILYQPKEES
jgi:hypothetical protein